MSMKFFCEDDSKTLLTGSDAIRGQKASAQFGYAMMNNFTKQEFIFMRL